MHCLRFAFLLALFAIYPVLGQTILREVWFDLTGTSVANLTNSSRYPNNPSVTTFPTSFNVEANTGDNFGTRMRGYVTAPITGNYTFYIAGDDNCVLLLSTNDTPDRARQIARVPSWSNYQAWTADPAQTSVAIPLVAGRRYYIEALQKEGSGGDHLSVGWRLPNGVLERPIPGVRLSPYQVFTTPPEIIDQPLDLTVDEGAPASFIARARGAEPLSYSWSRDGLPLQAETFPRIDILRVTLADNGGKFQCTIANALGQVVTREATLTVVPERQAPTVAQVHPPIGSPLRKLSQVELTFSEPILNVDAADILVNGSPATNVSGFGAGPYVFQFPEISSGAAVVTLAPTHGIHDHSMSSNALASLGNLQYQLNASAPQPDVIISEFVAANENGLLDSDGEPQDWIELWNRGSATANLAGWSLTDDEDHQNIWTLPNLSLIPGQRLVIFASGKENRLTSPYHTSFKIGSGAGYLALLNHESPRRAVTEFSPYPEQRNDHAFGITTSGEWRYFSVPTPGGDNGQSDIIGVAGEPEFNVERGFFTSPFVLALSTSLPDAQIRYTLDGSEPTLTNSIPYTGPFEIQSTAAIRAAVFKERYLPSKVVTHSYFFNVAAARLTLPTISIQTWRSNLIGPNGVIGIRGGTYVDGPWRAVQAGDYHNPSKHGIQWERPVSAELIFPRTGEGFQIDAGIRVQGSDYRRPRYTANSKFSYRLYFRGDYAAGKLEYPLFENSPVQEFDRIVLRAGHNDETNPFIKDEMMRRLFVQTGQVGSRGDFALLYVTNAYKGYYNYTERIDKQFCQAWHGGEEWDVLPQNLDPLDGDRLNFQAFMRFIDAGGFTNAQRYLEASRWIDLTNYVDYILVNAYGANGDWPHNNWRAGRERRDGALWRFYIWDAEFAFNTSNLSRDTFANELSGTSEIPRIWRALRPSPEFRLLFADRIQKHFYNDGALTQNNVTNQFFIMQRQLSGVIPSMDRAIANTWAPQRFRYLSNNFTRYQLFGTNAPSFSQHGGKVARGHQLSMSTTNGVIYYTTNGADPRIPFTTEIHQTAQRWTGPSLVLDRSTLVKARTLFNSTNWSGLTEARFEVADFVSPIRVSEVMYNPAGGGACEFVELHNAGDTPFDLTRASLDGIEFSFTDWGFLPPGERILLASNENPAAFLARYPGITVHGWFGGSLNNAGETLLLRDGQGQVLASVTYSDDLPWPTEADGDGYSLEFVKPDGDPNDPASWRASVSAFGTPGQGRAAEADSPIQISEVFASATTSMMPNFIEIQNVSSSSVNLSGWELRSGLTAQSLPNSILQPNARLVFWLGVPPEGQTGPVIGLDLGGTLSLRDDRSRTVDAITYSKPPAFFSMSRVGNRFQLGYPSPASEPTLAPTASPSALRINEWQSNPLTGQSDWIELFNSGSNPIALEGLFIVTTNGAARINYPTFIPTQGHAVFRANEGLTPDALPFKLPASGTFIELYSEAGNLIDRVVYQNQPEGVSHGRLPDGADVFRQFSLGGSPGASNYDPVSNGTEPRIEELMAQNLGAVVDPFGGLADWIEVYVPTNGSLEHYSIAIGSAKFTFTQAPLIPPSRRLVIWCDPLREFIVEGVLVSVPAGLSKDGERVSIIHPSGVTIDSVTFGKQIVNKSIGRVKADFDLLAQPSPGVVNGAAAIVASNAATLRLNEWHAASGNDDWIELHNSGDIPVRLSGMILTDEPSLAGLDKFVFPPLTFVDARSWAKFDATGSTRPSGSELPFQLNTIGENLRLYGISSNLAHSVYAYADASGGSVGSLVDSGAITTNFSMTPSPEGANHLPLPEVRITKVVRSPANAQQTAGVQFLAFGGPVDISGWWLTDDERVPNKFELPSNSLLSPWTPFVVTQANLDRELAVNRHTNLDGSRPMTLHLFERVNGQMTGRKTSVVIPSTVRGHAVHSVGIQQMIPAQNASLSEALTASRAHPLVISEVAPATLDRIGFVEIENRSASDVSLHSLAHPHARWKLEGAMEFLFPTNIVIPANGRALVLSASPLGFEAATFLQTASVPASVVVTGPYRARSNSLLDGVRLMQPEASVAWNNTLPGYSAHTVADIASLGHWTVDNMVERSLQRQHNGLFAALPITPGVANQVQVHIDTDADGLPDWWEIQFGGNPAAPGDHDLDSDLDGVSNLNEFRARTNPLEPTSVLRTEMRFGAAGQELRFVGAEGLSYTVQAAASLNGPWTPLIQDLNQSGEVIVSDPNAAAGPRFYRLHVD